LSDLHPAEVDVSLWRERGSVERPGRVELSTFPLAELYLPFVFLLGMVATLGPVGAVLLMGIVFALFLAAKRSLVRRGIYMSWGSRDMPAMFRVCYRVGYAFMLTGAGCRDSSQCGSRIGSPRTGADRLHERGRESVAADSAPRLRGAHGGGRTDAL
jgi:hypothetical protein